MAPGGTPDRAPRLRARRSRLWSAITRAAGRYVDRPTHRMATRPGAHVILDRGIDALRDAVLREMREAGLVACQFALAINGEVVVQETVGAAPPVARFLIFSATKPLVASAVWQLSGEGLLDPTRPVATWWPNFARNGKGAVTLEHVMVHTAGLPSA